MVSIARDMMLTVEEYMALRRMIDNAPSEGLTANEMRDEFAKEKMNVPTRKVSTYNRKYKAAFKKIAPKYKLKSGKWKKNGFKSAVRAAHKEAKK